MDLKTILTKLSQERPIFYNEADFQHSLAWAIREHYPEAKIRLEMKVHGPETKVYLDILASIAGRKYAIELKYKTRNFVHVIDEEQFSLSNHGAQDTGRYDVLKDLQRLEQMVECGVVDEGMVVFLTNEVSYYSSSGEEKQTADRDFRLHDGRQIHGKLSWSEHTGQGTMKGREEPITLQRQYQLRWNVYTNISNTNAGEFRYLLLPVDKTQTTATAFTNQYSNLDIPKIELKTPVVINSQTKHVKYDCVKPWFHSFSESRQIPLSQVDLRDRLARHLRDLGYLVYTNRDLGSDKVDIWAERDRETIAIEVRNKTALLHTMYEGQSINLKNQAAHDVSRYDFIRDIGKLERVVRQRPETNGYALLLTNDHSYWQPPKKQKSVDDSFRIHDGRILAEMCSWSEQAGSGTTFGRDEPIHLSGSYPLQWLPYVTLSNKKNHEFKALLVEVTNRRDR